MNNDIINKNKIFIVENIDKDLAEQSSLKYPNGIFFTSSGEIIKNGISYSAIKGVDPNNNKIMLDGQIYELIIENQMLKFVRKTGWFWYIGCDIQTTVNNLQFDNSNNTGWRFISDRKEIINASINIDPNLFKSGIWPINNNASRIILTEEEKLQSTIYLYLPKNLVNENIYNVGLYDSINITNFFNEGNVLTKIKEVTIDNAKYIMYKFNEKLKDVFDLKIYKK